MDISEQDQAIKRMESALWACEATAQRMEAAGRWDEASRYYDACIVVSKALRAAYRRRESTLDKQAPRDRNVR